jgi:hypothetical protein
MLMRAVYTKERDLQSIRYHWKTYFGALKAYSLPDIQPAVDIAQAYERVDDWDMSVLLESFYLMRQWTAVDEFSARWKDEGERMNLWNEIVGFWGYSQVYPFPPVPHRQGPMR